MTYLDNAASAMPMQWPEGVQPNEAIFGNPGSRHRVGIRARQILDESRVAIAKGIGIGNDAIRFCSGATEAANLLLTGLARRQLKINGQRREILLSAIEHPCIHNTAMSLREYGFDARTINVDSNGRLDRSHLEFNLRPGRTLAVAVMAVNNEIGTIQDISRIAQQVKSKDEGIFFLCDVVQAIGKVQFQFTDDIDALFFCGHKLDGLTRCGGFYLNPNIAIEPLFMGGGQEDGLRPGTESVIQASRLASTLTSRLDGLAANLEKASWLRDVLIRRLADSGLPCRPTVDPQSASPYIVSLVCEGSSAKDIVQYLSDRDIYVSRGSACSSTSATPSRILQAINCSGSDSIIRVSFAPENDEQDIAGIVTALQSFF